jgi:hypothetical protein
VLRTRSPVYSPLRAFSLDLHVLGTPPAFVLSQDQTLQLSIGVSFLAHLSRVPRLAGHDRCTQSIASSAILLRGLAIQFSETDLARPSHSALPTTPPPRRLQHPGEGRASYRCQLLRVKDLASVPARTPRLQGPRCVADRPGAVNFLGRPASNLARRLQIPPPFDGFGAMAFFRPCPTR